MTIETCKKRLALAKVSKDPLQVKFWEERIARKIARHAKYKEDDPAASNKLKGKS